MKIAFWISLFLVFYTFAGYGLLLYFIVRMQRLFIQKKTKTAPIDHPTLTLIIAAYNEADIIAEKIANCRALNYPKDRLRILFVSDGSTDGTGQIIQQHAGIDLLHSAERRGKIHAIHRAMKTVTSEIVVFTDANTLLNEEALELMARHYKNPKVGAVSGEKRVAVDVVSDATAGEGFYWKYESALKKWDAALSTLVGAAGELFSIRTALYQPVPEDTVLDDFMISMRISEQGYQVAYEPEAFASETASANIKEEWKRKVRIAAGGIQSISRLPGLWNLFRHPLLTFQYISHRVLRWTITPFLLLTAFVLNAVIAGQGGGWIYQILLALQVLFYAMAFTGQLLALRQLKVKLFFIPYYFCLMNAAVIAGIYRYCISNNKQSVLWEKAARKSLVVR